MFTPQRRNSGKTATFTPHRATPFPSSAKGKGVVIADEPPPPPPLVSLSETRGETALASGLNSAYVKDWKNFREVGLLDEEAMQRKDHEALLEKASRLEREVC
jgi:hypothetical protein